MGGARSGAVAALAVMAAVVGWLCWQRLMATDPAPEWFAEIDLRNYFFPSLCFVRSQLAQGSLPLWDPYQLLGVPFAAAFQPAVFYPLLTPLLVLRPEHALVVHGLLHLVLAGFFTWLYLRILGVGWWAAAIGGLAFLLSPGITQSLYNTAFLSSRIWLPALLAAIEVVARRPARVPCACLAAVVAMILLSGSAQSAVYMFQFGALYACLALVLQRGNGQTLRAAGCLAGGALLGVALAAVQLGPTLELAMDGVRSLAGIPEVRAGASGVDPDELVALGRALGRQFDPLFVVVLAAAAVLGRGLRAYGVFFWLTLVAACDFQLGNTGSVFPLYYRLPLGNLFQIPERIFFLSGFAGACLYGLGAAAILRWLSGRRVAAAIAVTAMLMTAVWPPLVDERQPRAWSPLAAPQGLYGDPGVMALATSATEQQRVMLRFRHEDQRVPPRAGSIHRFLMMYDYEPLLPAAYAHAFSIRDDLPWRGRVVPAADSSQRGGTDFAVDFAYLDSIGVRYYVDARGGGPASLFERRSALPRAYATTNLVHASTDEEALELVTSGKLDLREKVVVTSAARLLDPTPGNAEPGEVKIVSGRAGEVVLTTACEHSCLVVLSDLAYPGWRASVDDREADTIRANYLLRSVIVPAGSHTVRFRYSPRSFQIGAALSLVALAALVLLVLRRRTDAEGGPGGGRTLS